MGQPGRVVDRGDVNDQRVEARPALGLEQPGDRAIVAGIGAEPIDRLGRKRDQRAAFQQIGRRLDCRRTRRQAPRPSAAPCCLVGHSRDSDFVVIVWQSKRRLRPVQGRVGRRRCLVSSRSTLGRDRETVL